MPFIKPKYLALPLACLLGMATTASANDAVVYTSDNSVRTYSPIFPSYADSSWPGSVCNVNSSLGLDAGWVDHGFAYQFGT